MLVLKCMEDTITYCETAFHIILSVTILMSCLTLPLLIMLHLQLKLKSTVLYLILHANVQIYKANVKHAVHLTLSPCYST